MKNTMTTGQLKRLLKQANMTQRRLAQLLRIHERTMRTFIAGAEIPGPVAIAVRCLLEHQVVA